MKNLTTYLNIEKHINEQQVNEQQVNEMHFDNDSYKEYAEYCLGNNQGMIDKFGYLLEQLFYSLYDKTTIDDFNDLYEDDEDAAENAEYFDMLEDMADENDAMHNIYYTVYDACKGINRDAKKSFINEMAHKYCREQLENKL